MTSIHDIEQRKHIKKRAARVAVSEFEDESKMNLWFVLDQCQTMIADSEHEIEGLYGRVYIVENHDYENLSKYTVRVGSKKWDVIYTSNVVSEGPDIELIREYSDDKVDSGRKECDCTDLRKTDDGVLIHEDGCPVLNGARVHSLNKSDTEGDSE